MTKEKEKLDSLLKIAMPRNKDLAARNLYKEIKTGSSSEKQAWEKLLEGEIFRSAVNYANFLVKNFSCLSKKTSCLIKAQSS